MSVRLRIHPLLPLFALVGLALGLRQEMLALAVSLAVHESAHLLAARALGLRVDQLRLMPFGGALALGNPYALSPASLALTAAAGPAGSLALVVLSAALAHWSAIDPFAAVHLARLNLTLALFNLLPALPLDGGRVLYALCTPKLGRERAANLGLWGGRIVAALLLGAALYTALSRRQVNLSYIVSAAFILASAPEERRALSGVRPQALLEALRPLSSPAPARLMAVSAATPLREALRAASPDAPTLFAVYEGLTLRALTDDRALMRAALDADAATLLSHLPPAGFWPGREWDGNGGAMHIL